MKGTREIEEKCPECGTNLMYADFATYFPDTATENNGCFVYCTSCGYALCN